MSDDTLDVIVNPPVVLPVSVVSGGGARGNPGAAATIAIGTTETLAAGEDATAENVGTSTAAILNLGIPQGAQGIQGIRGNTGLTGATGNTGASINRRGAYSGAGVYVANDGVVSGGLDYYLPVGYVGSVTGTAPPTSPWLLESGAQYAANAASSATAAQTAAGTIRTRRQRLIGQASITVIRAYRDGQSPQHIDRIGRTVISVDTDQILGRRKRQRLIAQPAYRSVKVSSDGYVTGGATLFDLTLRGEQAAIDDLQAQIDGLGVAVDGLKATGLAYISGGALRAFTAFAGDILLDDNCVYLDCQTQGGNVLAKRINFDGDVELVSVSILTGNVFAAGVAVLITGEGQSNMEGKSVGDSVAWFTTNPYRRNLMMPATIRDDTWLIPPTDSAASNPVAAGIIQAGVITRYRSGLGDRNHGTTACESMAMAMAKQTTDELGSTADICVWNNAEGGQSIRNLTEFAFGSAGTITNESLGYYAHSNFVTINTLLNDHYVNVLKTRLTLPWLPMLQGEANSSNFQLAQEQEGMRADREAAWTVITAATGTPQTERVGLLTVAMSSFFGSGTNAGLGAKSFIVQHLVTRAGSGYTWHVGPSYPGAYTDYDVLHHTIEAGVRMGQFINMVKNRIKKYGFWDPLYITGWTHTNANTITATLSEPAVIDTGNRFVAAIAHAGVEATGANVTGVSVAGTTLTITFAGNAASVTELNIASSGHIATSATGVLTFTGAGTNGDTITIGLDTADVDPIVYRLVNVLAQPYDMLIGANATITAQHMTSAIGVGSGAGTAYAIGTLHNPDINASNGSAGVINMTAGDAGTVGNGIITTETSSACSFGAATLTGGTGGTRTQATIPRSNLRSVAIYGTYDDGDDMVKWACHQDI